MCSVTSFLNIKTSGCSCPDLWQFAAEAHPVFYFCSWKWDQLGPTASTGQLLPQDGKAFILSSEVAVSSSVFADWDFTVNRGCWLCDGMNWPANHWSAWVTSPGLCTAKLVMILRRESLCQGLVKWPKVLPQETVLSWMPLSVTSSSVSISAFLVIVVVLCVIHISCTYSPNLFDADEENEVRSPPHQTLWTSVELQMLTSALVEQLVHVHLRMCMCTWWSTCGDDASGRCWGWHVYLRMCICTWWSACGDDASGRC